ncbi:MAG: hypothetical protein A3J48_04300 [Candidatus Doudnabacteria bacterium RIFCSPHIGHO2_02_FULL_46_11]|uniref:Uncharacterized protein n=1 Tax=Candidatus Doudnabacteria bacterium RIFCSPHIGHO2_02_FULL_46_11 TaxID=1817832 RepID=A0A1F5P546_9BACT|nr:MAG: hypothetical protein A3J48_04300 [Candidatus Doudnabacteria bacterium RIFCSPHIGHO2_02_FULL_46_11]
MSFDIGFLFCCRGIERERGRENGSFPVEEKLKPSGFRAETLSKTSRAVISPLGLPIIKFTHLLNRIFYAKDI